MWIIAGLGNPGQRYDRTPHNLGFEAVRVLAMRHGMRWGDSRRAQALEAPGEINGQKVLLLQPLTFMNLSGEAVRPYATFYKVLPSKVLVLTDDVAIPWGKLRVRAGGSAGGHNGLRNLILHLGTDKFPRIRIGCEPEGWRGTLKDYVLCKLAGNALEIAEHMAQIGADATESILRDGVPKAQNEWNGYDACE